ncbi:MAG: hypothetical protein ACPG4T_16220, partial [Nannocystaceae bacterium]
TPLNAQETTEERVPEPVAPQDSAQPNGAEQAENKPPPRVSEISFAGIRLNQALGDVVKQGPLAKICDVDQLSDSVNLVAYGKDCEEDSFGHDSSILLYVTGKLEDEGDLPQQVVQGIVWFGGFFDSRSEFPGKASMSRTQVNEALGPFTHSCDIGDEEDRLVVQFHPGGMYTIVRGETVVGYGAGKKMPESCEDDQWQILIDVYYELHTLSS